MRRIKTCWLYKIDISEFWLIPGIGNEDPRRNPAGRYRRMDIVNVDTVVINENAKFVHGTIEKRMTNVTR